MSLNRTGTGTGGSEWSKDAVNGCGGDVLQLELAVDVIDSKLELGRDFQTQAAMYDHSETYDLAYPLYKKSLRAFLDAYSLLPTQDTRRPRLYKHIDRLLSRAETIEKELDEVGELLQLSVWVNGADEQHPPASHPRLSPDVGVPKEGSSVDLKALVTIPTLLLYGLAGTGKTTIARSLSILWGASLQEVCVSNLDASCFSPTDTKTVLFVRLANVLRQPSSSKERQHFEVWVRQQVEAGRKVVVTVSTSDPAETIEHPLFTRCVYVPLPSASQRLLLLTTFLDTHNHCVDKESLRSLANDLDDWTPRDLRELVEEAVCDIQTRFRTSKHLVRREEDGGWEPCSCVSPCPASSHTDTWDHLTREEQARLPPLSFQWLKRKSEERQLRKEKAP